jgi:YD repeat-containing protein
MTSTGSSWGSPGGPTWGTTTVIRGELTRDGATGGRTQHIEQCVHFDSCPSAEGIVTGTWRFAHEEVLSASKDGVGGTIRLTMQATAKLTGHVGADGRATTFDWTGEGRARRVGRRPPRARPPSTRSTRPSA